MMKHTSRLSGKSVKFLPLIAAFAMVISACTPEGVINKTKYQGEKITNTCDQFKDEVESLVSSNSSPSELVVAEYDNSDFGGASLDPGQFEIKDGVLYFRLAQDLEYDKYLHKGVAVHVHASFESLDHLADMESPNEGPVGMLVVDRAYYDANKEPYFTYAIPIEGNADDLTGRQVKLDFSVVKYNKKGKLKKVFCNSVEAPIGTVTPACCSYKPWDKASVQSVIEMPDIDIKDEKYRYKGFTGTLDFIFPMGSTKFDKTLLSEAIQDYIKKYEELGYKIQAVNLEGYASLGGKEDKNQTLSEKRAKAVYDDLVAALDSASFTITHAGKGEDWNRLVLLTKASALTGEEQQAVLAIANNNTLSNDEKEAEMRKLEFWEKLVDEVIVNTRHTFVTFNFSYTPDKMYVEDYPSQMPVISDELLNVASKQMVVTKFKEGESVKKNMRVLDILIGNNKKPNLYAMRSTYHFANNDVSNAITDIESAQDLDKGNTQYAMAALAYKTKYADSYSLDERMEMLDMYNDYVQKYPGNAGLLFNRAVMMDKVGYISGALAEYDDLLEGKEASAAAVNNRGVAKLKSMRIAEAQMDFERAIEKDDKLAHPYFNMALIYAYRGLTSKAAENLETAVGLEPALRDEIFSNPAFRVMKDKPEFDKFR